MEPRATELPVATGAVGVWFGTITDAQHALTRAAAHVPAYDAIHNAVRAGIEWHRVHGSS